MKDLPEPIAEWSVQWLRHGVPLPDGWYFVETPVSHHSVHARLISDRPDLEGGRGERE